MKNLLLLLLVGVGLISAVSAQTEKPSDVKMRAQYGSENAELQSVLYFENIGLDKITFSGSDLKGKDFQLSVKEFVGGRLTKSEVVSDSKEDEYFKIKTDQFGFRVLTKTTAENTVRFDFQFNGFYKQKEYKIAAG